VLRGIDWRNVSIDYILCEAHCESVLQPLGYLPRTLHHLRANASGARRHALTRRDRQGELVWIAPHVLQKPSSRVSKQAVARSWFG
jgi:hypothetical protein